MISYGKRMSAVGLLAALLLGTAAAVHRLNRQVQIRLVPAEPRCPPLLLPPFHPHAPLPLSRCPPGRRKRPESSSPMGTSADSAGGGTTLTQRPELEKGSLRMSQVRIIRWETCILFTMRGIRPGICFIW